MFTAQKDYWAPKAGVLLELWSVPFSKSAFSPVYVFKLDKVVGWMLVKKDVFGWKTYSNFKKVHLESPKNRLNMISVTLKLLF